MPSSYTPLLRLTLPADGELVGTWGQTVNNGITSLEEAAIAGTASVALVDADYVMSVANGAADVARNATVRFTGALTAQRNITVPSSSKNYFIRNATTGGFGLNVKTAAGTGVVVPAGGAMLVYCDGVNVMQAVDSIGPGGIDGTPDLILKSSGTEKMRILANGNVGIGTSPTYKLQVLSVPPTGLGVFRDADAAASTAGVFLDLGARVGAVQTPGAQLAGVVDNGTTGFLTISTRTAGALTEKMRIDSAGNVNIGSGAIPAGNLRAVVLNHGNVVTHAMQIAGVDKGALYADVGQFAVIAVGAATPLTFTVNGSERMRIDSSGNVGIGNLPGAMGDRRLGVQSAGATDGVAAVFCNNGSTGAGIQFLQNGIDTFTLSMPPGGGGLRFIQGGSTERMRITPIGEWLLKKAVADFTEVGVQYKPGPSEFGVTALDNYPFFLNRQGTDGVIMQILKGNSGVGSISVTATATAFNTSSDYRLKDAIEDLQGSGNFIDALRPRLFTWKATGERSAGFIAHEFAEVSRSSVSGEKDAVDEEGNPQMQGMQASSSEVMANIIAELKSLRLRVAALGG